MKGIQNSTVRARRGAVLVYVSLVLAIIFAVVALMVDSALVSAAREQAQQYTKLMALGAVEQYFTLRGAGETASVALEGARQRALAILADKAIVGSGHESATLSLAPGDPGLHLIPGA
jgi:uncharacterized membrane protein